MENVGSPEWNSQQRIVKLFREKLGYTYLGDWRDRDNSNIEEEYLRKYLVRKGHSESLIAKVIHELKITANNNNHDLYTNNKNVYGLLRYGISKKEEVGSNSQTVQLINWLDPEDNDFYIAEEVTVRGNQTKRPDIVLYVNGIALAIMELKRSIVSIGDGIRQSLVNQKPEFIGSFFSTIQFIFAGNDTEGLRYGTIGTPEKFFLSWKEDEDDTSMLQVDKYLTKMCNKDRFMELMYDFVLFDGGIKKLPRVHQYFGLKAAQENVRKREGGIIWHTQGSGKSLVMVMLAKWILENNPHARVAVITDRTELDKQIRDVFEASGEPIHRAKSGSDLLSQLSLPSPRLLCSLVHKFGVRNSSNFEQYIKELESQPTEVFGELFVFVDECHRTQSGKLHRAMSARMPSAVFIGFTGTPLLAKDRKTTLEVFGSYIHTYKFNEAVEDEIVRDLVYEARDIDQRLSSPQRVDDWFDAKTKGLNDFQRSELKKKWATMQQVLSSKSRMDKVVTDIVFDFGTKARLSSQRGNAILVASSIFEAVRYYVMFQGTSLKGKCAVITSYNPTTRDVVHEEIGANTETDKQYIYNHYTELLRDVDEVTGKTKTEAYEDWAKDKFINEPANMKLLIVVDKLLTGFDAPACTYLYIDKSMKDHGLFQAICRTNRLDTDDKQFGHIVDYKNLFDQVKGAIEVYTSELDYDDFDKEECSIMMQDRLKKGKQRLDNAREQLALLCEPVAPPKGDLEHIRYFCGNPEKKSELKAKEPARTSLYKAIVALIRAYANIADELSEAGYTEQEILEIKKDNDHYLKLREVIRLASGEVLDMKAYEADMRHLIDHYIQADEARKLIDFGELTLLDVINRTGIDDAIKGLPENIRKNKDAVAETIENNVRQKIIRDHLLDPAFFDEMSKVLDEIIKERKNAAIDYEEYLKKIALLAKMAGEGKKEDTPSALDTPGKRALYNNLNKNEALATDLDAAVKEAKGADWRGNPQKENEIKAAIYKFVADIGEVERIFEIIKQQPEY